MTRDDLRGKSTPWHVWASMFITVTAILGGGLLLAVNVTRSMTEIEGNLSSDIRANKVSISSARERFGLHRGVATARIDDIDDAVQESQVTNARIEQQLLNNAAALVRIERSITRNGP